MSAQELKNFLRDLKTVKPLVLTAKNNPVALKEWLVDRPYDVNAVQTFIRNFNNIDPTALRLFLLGLKNPLVLETFIEGYSERLALLARAIKVLEPSAEFFNNRLTQYDDHLENFQWINCLGQIGILINFAATDPQALQVLLANEPEMVKQINQFVQEKIPANKLVIFLEALKKFKAESNAIVEFLQQHPELKEALLENRTQLLAIKDTLRKANYNAYLLKAKPLITLIFEKSATLGQQVNEQQWQGIVSFSDYFKKLDGAKFNKIKDKIKQLESARENLKYEKEKNPELVVSVEAKLKIIENKIKNLKIEQKQTISAMFCEALQQIESNPHKLDNFLKYHPQINHYLTENLAALAEIAEVVVAAKASARPLLSENTEPFNYFETQDTIFHLLHGPLKPMLENETKYNQVAEWFNYINEYSNSNDHEQQEKIQLIKAEPIYQALGKICDLTTRYLKVLDRDLGGEVSHDELLSGVILKLQTFDNKKLQKLKAPLDYGRAYGADFSRLEKLTIKMLESESVAYGLTTLNSAALFLLEQRRELRNKLLVAHDKPFDILNVLKDFLQNFYGKEVKVTTIADLSAEEITAAIYTNLISSLSSAQLNQLKQLPKEIDDADSLNNRIWQSFQAGLNKAFVGLGPLNPLSHHNPFNKEGISFNTLFVINRLYRASELLVESEASDEAIKTSLRNELLANLTPAEIMELDKAEVDLKAIEPSLDRFLQCLKAEVSHIRLYPENSINPFKQAKVNENIIKLIYEIYEDTKHLKVFEESNSIIRTKLDLELLGRLSTDELLTLKSIVNTIVEPDPLLSRFFKAFTEELTYQLEGKRDYIFGPKALQQMATHIQNQTLPELDKSIDRLTAKAKWPFFQAGMVNIAQNKLNELQQLRSKLDNERKAILISKSGLEQGIIKQAGNCIKTHKENFDRLIDISLANTEVNAHCNVLKGLVNAVTETLQTIKTSFSQLYTKIWQSKPAEKVNEPIKARSQYPGFFKTQSHKELEAIRNQAMSISTEKLEQIEQTIAFKRG